MISAIQQPDYATRDRQGKIAFYVLLWKRKGISVELFQQYWRNVHGPLCARLPGQHQYWQFHLAPNDGGIWPAVDGIDYTCPATEQFHGIAELTFTTEAELQAYKDAFSILMADEHNLFSKAIAYTTTSGNSQTYIDRIPTGEPNGELDVIKFHVLVKKAELVSVGAFRRYITESFAPAIVKSDSVLKFRLHLLEEVDNSRPDDDGVCRYEPVENQYQAAFEIAFANPLEMERFFASKQYAKAVKDQARYIERLYPFPERAAYTFVYDGEPTLAGQRSSNVAELIAKIGATNQLQQNITSLFATTQEENDMTKQNGSNGKTLTATAAVPAIISTSQDLTSHRIHSTYSSPVHASFATVWQMMLDKVENPGRYNPVACDYQILERYSNGVLRQMKAANMTVKEIITWNENTGEIKHTLVDNPFFVGEAINGVYKTENGSLVLTYTVNWEPYNQEGRKIAQEIRTKISQAVEQAVLKGVSIAEQQEAQASPRIAYGTQPIPDQFPGTISELALRLFARGESFDSHGFSELFTETPVYQFGNYAPCLTKAEIQQSTAAFFSQIAALYHDIKMLWEVGNTLFLEMDVIYWRKDGSVVSLPCFDVFRVEGGKFSELRIFMDANPVGDATIPVSSTSSVFTGSQGNRLATSSDLMKKFFAEHPEAKTRIANGFTPKWAIAGPRWPINGTSIKGLPLR
ncbi:ethyl tert-butyl ether degradation EthD (plasmid) [Nostoc sp. NIES-3756]|uniref:AtaL-like protein n=1 Tax=Nostoc sp. NIES-3756 TaxID=1751286 RepID=UPI00071FCA67|nr:AtaL-like protein [Nostoc sp. NIES-3756]BAT56906.1 ethyl tert-butyl ether degradation EthD [Nostoc sp. NIES-3756]